MEATQTGWLEPGTIVVRRKRPNDRGTVGYHVGYITHDGTEIHAVWRYVFWDDSRATLVRAIELVAVDEPDHAQGALEGRIIDGVPYTANVRETRGARLRSDPQAQPAPVRDKGAAILRGIEYLYEANGRPATVRELAEHIGIDSTGNVSYHLIELQRRGYAYTMSGARGWRITEEGKARIAFLEQERQNRSRRT